jgi:hypothetical protein
LLLCQQLARLGPRHGLSRTDLGDRAISQLISYKLVRALKDFYDITPACRAGVDRNTRGGDVDPELPDEA